MAGRVSWREDLEGEDLEGQTQTQSNWIGWMTLQSCGGLAGS